MNQEKYNKFIANEQEWHTELTNRVPIRALYKDYVADKDADDYTDFNSVSECIDYTQKNYDLLRFKLKIAMEYRCDMSGIYEFNEYYHGMLFMFVKFYIHLKKIIADEYGCRNDIDKDPQTKEILIILIKRVRKFIDEVLASILCTYEFHNCIVNKQDYNEVKKVYAEIVDHVKRYLPETLKLI